MMLCLKVSVVMRQKPQDVLDNYYITEYFLSSTVNILLIFHKEFYKKIIYV